MKNALLAIFCIAALYSNAQTLEHTYPAQTSIYHVDQNEWDYAFNDGSNAYIYSLNHSLVITIPINAPQGNFGVGVWSVSKNLFSSSGEYEIAYYYTLAGGFDHTTVINQDGTSLLESDSTSEGTFFNTPQGTKLLLYGNATRVYSVTGTYYSTISDVKNVSNNQIEMELAYPNPSRDMIHLPYNLSGNKGTMFITNQAGQMIRQLPLGPNFNDIIFDASMLPSGVYFYTTKDENGVVGKAATFVKQ